jgi:DNA-binding transcriptional ArsR family regulator
MPKKTAPAIAYNKELVTAVRDKLISGAYSLELSAFFKVMGDETRVKIIYALAEQEMCVNDLAMVLGMTQSAVSHQLKLLKMENQVKSRREGKNIYYSLDDQHVVEILEAALCHVRHKLRERK